MLGAWWVGGKKGKKRSECPNRKAEKKSIRFVEAV